MIKTLLVGLCIFLAVCLISFLLRKFLLGLILVILVFSVGIYGLNSKGIYIGDVVDLVDIREKAIKLGGIVEYNKDNKEVVINGKDYFLKINKDEESGEYLIEGEAPAVSEDGLKGLLSLANVASKTLNIESVWDNIGTYDKDNDSFKGVVSESVGFMGNGLSDVISNPEELQGMVSYMEESGDNLMLGNLIIDVEDGKVRLNKFLKD